MNIHDIIKLIPDQSENEALMSIQSIRIDPPRKARLTCYLSKKFFITLEAKRGGEVLINGAQCDSGRFLAALKKAIYHEDEAETPAVILKKRVTYIPSPPADMDIPVWDEKTGKWYDAEY